MSGIPVKRLSIVTGGSDGRICCDYCTPRKGCYRHEVVQSSVVSTRAMDGALWMACPGQEERREKPVPETTKARNWVWNGKLGQNLGVQEKKQFLRGPAWCCESQGLRAALLLPKQESLYRKTGCGFVVMRDRDRRFLQQFVNLRRRGPWQE